MRNGTPRAKQPRSDRHLGTRLRQEIVVKNYVNLGDANSGWT